jgi:hypothetical protein
MDRSTFKYYCADTLIHFGEEDAKPYAAKNDLTLGIVDFFRIPTGKLTFFTDRSRFQF